MTIRISTPAPFLPEEFRLKDPDAFQVLALLHYEFGDAPFHIRPEWRPRDWVHNRFLGAVARLFAHEILAEVEETWH